MYVSNIRLKAEIERKDVEYEEGVVLMQSRHTAEIENLQEMLADMEVNRQALQAEISALRNRMASMRNDIVQEQQDVTHNLRQQHDRDKSSLEEQIRQLQKEVLSVFIFHDCILGYCVVLCRSSKRRGKLVIVSKNVLFTLF